MNEPRCPHCGYSYSMYYDHLKTGAYNERKRIIDDLKKALEETKGSWSAWEVLDALEGRPPISVKFPIDGPGFIEKLVIRKVEDE